MSGRSSGDSVSAALDYSDTSSRERSTSRARYYRNDGDCSSSYRRHLQNIVDRVCKPNPGSCTPADSCAEAMAKEAAHTACAEARKKINSTCYRGGDRGHQIEYTTRQQQAITCRGFINK